MGLDSSILLLQQSPYHQIYIQSGVTKISEVLLEGYWLYIIKKKIMKIKNEIYIFKWIKWLKSKFRNLNSQI